MAEDIRQGRGVRLGDLDRNRRWVLAYTGRRWEVLGPLEDPEGGPQVAADAGAGDGVASTAPQPPGADGGA